ncbi:C-type lectin mannose-binding isoform-like [Uranotaenia lowii]|uniref:C-type lectin mannose-binding isoform-like n=1 Tax=Uranotaenia lowii TaxID=190385 RepID=UPI00247ADD43|nr:C-type lectin mannose-binding isoform-like [Uranotaenia lowii]
MSSKLLFVLVSLVGFIFCQELQLAGNRYVVHPGPATFFEAWQQCRDFGLRLATVQSKPDSVELAEVIETSGIKPFNGAWWIAATDLGNPSFNYTWISTNKVVGYTDFADHQPDNNENNENCLEVGRYGGVKWNDGPCTKKISFICERFSGNGC